MTEPARLAFIGLDGVCIDSTKKFENAKNLYPHNQKEFWKYVFEPVNVMFDQPVPGAVEKIQQIEQDMQWQIIFLTSRPERMRNATEEWLWQNDLMFYQRKLVMKPGHDQFTPTPQWESETVCNWVYAMRGNPVLVVDYEQKNLDAIFKMLCQPRFKNIDYYLYQSLEQVG